MWEKQGRRMWEELDIAHRKIIETEELLDQLDVGVVVVNSQNQSLYSNEKGKEFYSDQAKGSSEVLRQLTDSSWKHEHREELIEIKPKNWVLASSQRISWNTVNASLLSMENASQYIEVFHSLCVQNRFIITELGMIESSLMREYFDSEGLLGFHSLCKVHMVKHHLSNQQTLLRELTSTCEDSNSVLNIRTEVLNVIELTNDVAESKEMFVSLVFEQGIPRTLEGNRHATMQLFTFAYSLSSGLSVKSGNINISVIVSGVAEGSLSLMIKFEFVAEAQNAVDICKEFTQSKNINGGQSRIIEAFDNPQKAAIDAFSRLLKRVGGWCQASVRLSAVEGTLTVLLWYQYSLQVKQREVSISTLIPSEIRRIVTNDKFIWDFRPSSDPKSAQSKRSKRGSFRLHRKLQKVRTINEDLNSLDTVVEQNSGEVVDKGEVPSPPLPSDVSEHVNTESLKRDLLRNPCDIGAKSPFQETRSIIDRTKTT